MTQNCICLSQVNHIITYSPILEMKGQRGESVREITLNYYLCGRVKSVAPRRAQE